MPDRLVLTSEINSVPVEIYERSAMIPNPALSMVPTKTVIECFFVHPAPDWPKVRIRARRGFARLLYRLGRRPGLKLDDPRFNAAFRVETENEDFAFLLLSPDLRAFLLTKTTVDWSAGEGAIKLFYRGKLRKKRLAKSLHRLRNFIRLIDPELYELFEEHLSTPR